MSSISTIKSTRSENHFEDVQYNGKSYCVCYIPIRECLFVIDSEDKDKIKSVNVSSNNYIRCQDGYIHRLIINAGGYTGKNPVDHINRIPRDNRKENLRITTNSENVRNRNKMKRNLDLPEGCGIDPQDIPKNIWYMKDEGTGPNKHGERWCLEIKGLPKDKFKNGEIVWKSTSNRDISLKVKLEQTIQKLNELIVLYSEIKMATASGDNDKDRENLVNSFNEILRLSKYPKEIIEKNLVVFKTDIVSLDTSDEIKSSATKSLLIQKSGKKKEYDFPIDFDYSQLEVPKYVSYRKATLKRGDFFIIENHPNLKKHKNKLGNTMTEISSRSSKLIPTSEKYEEILSYLKSLENDLPFEEFETVRAKRGQVKEMKNTSEKFLPEEIPKSEKKLITNLPESCGIDPKDIPEYIGYNKAKPNRGDSFFIRPTHPKLKEKGLSQISTTTSILVSTKDKLEQIKVKLISLESDIEVNIKEI
jgi:hypothetical protein